jgi:hypothetical protein
MGVEPPPLAKWGVAKPLPFDHPSEHIWGGSTTPHLAKIGWLDHLFLRFFYEKHFS